MSEEPEVKEASSSASEAGAKRRREARKRDPTDSAPSGITELAASGYKSIVGFHSIEIRPLTILAGANGSGKSNIIQPLLLLKQTLEASYDPGPLMLEGPNVTFTSASQFFSSLGNRRFAETFVAGIGIGSDIRVALAFKRDPKEGIQIHEMSFAQGRVRRKLRPEMKSAELESCFPAITKKWIEALGEWQPGDSTAKRRPEDSVTLRLQRNRCFLEFVVRYEPAGEFATGFPMARAGDEIRRLIHVPGPRGNAERTYPVAGVDGAFPGTFEKYVASVIARWQAEDKNKLEALSQALDTLGLACRIVARPVGETQIELKVGRMARGKGEDENDLVSVADAGSGVSQTLPALVALLAAEPGQAVYLEEPGIHLPPRAQAQMAGILAEAAVRGVRVIAETRSSILLRSIQTLVTTGKLPPELVKLHWFTRKPADGSTQIHSADLGKPDAFDNCPADFDEAPLETRPPGGVSGG
jgi:hypothetical protein